MENLTLSGIIQDVVFSCRVIHISQLMWNKFPRQIVFRLEGILFIYAIRENKFEVSTVTGTNVTFMYCLFYPYLYTARADYVPLILFGP